MKVDVIICTHNRAEMLRNALESMLATDIPANTSLRIIVVNNNSKDATDEILKAFLKKITRDDITYIHEEKKGKSHALNRALSEVEGDVIVFFDDDQTVGKEWLEEIANALNKYPDYNCFGGKVLACYPENLPSWLDIDGTMVFLRSVFGHKDEGDREVEYGNGTISATPGGGNMFFRKRAVEKNGLFRTDLGPVGGKLGFSEDTDYCHRLMDKGERFIYIPSVVVYHQVPAYRLKKKYLLDWQYSVGRYEVRRNGGYKDTIKILGVPRYLFRKLIMHILSWCFSIRSKYRFYHRLRFYHTAGEIIEHFNIGFKKL